MDFGTILGSILGPAGVPFQILLIRMASFCKLFLKPLPERLEDQFGIQRLRKVLFWEGPGHSYYRERLGVAAFSTHEVYPHNA